MSIPTLTLTSLSRISLKTTIARDLFVLRTLNMQLQPSSRLFSTLSKQPTPKLSKSILSSLNFKTVNARSFSLKSFLSKSTNSTTPTKNAKSALITVSKNEKKIVPSTALPTERQNDPREIMNQMLKYLWPKNKTSYKVRVVIALSLLFGSKLLNVQVPFYFKSIVDEMNIDWVNTAGTITTTIAAMIVAYGLARFGAVFFGELRNAIFASVAQGAIRKVALNTFDHLLKLDLQFHLSRQTGGLTRAIDRGTKGISYVLTAMVFHIIPITFEISVVCGILTYNYGLSFAAVTLTTMLAYSIFTIRTTTWRTNFRRQANNADNQAASVALDSLINYEAVKYFNNEPYQVSKYDFALKKYQNASIKVATSLAFLNAGQNLIFTSALTAMMLMGCNGVAAGELSVGDLVLINQLVFQLSVPLNFLGSVYRELKQSFLDMETLFNLQQVKLKIIDIPNAKPLIVSKGEIKFENVSFGYHPDRPILKNCSFIIPAGKKVAVVGPSGAGKSTILKLLFRFYDVQSGHIYIDGQDISKVTVESLQKAIGVVPQETPLFNDTILENIRYGRLGADDEEVLSAAKKAKLDRLISQLPEGVETVVGERGMMISGGEKQRLAISRLLLKNAPITFFDEATSALDTHTEQSLLRSIKTIFKETNNTNVFIAHRLRTIADADKIIVLQDGSVVEEGSHHELIAHRGIYEGLWHIQEHLDLEKYTGEKIEPEITETTIEK